MNNGNIVLHRPQYAKQEPIAFPSTLLPEREKARSTFIHNMALPVHGWFRFSAGFSAAWVENVVQSRKGNINGLAFLDPFAGVGTAVLAADKLGVRAYGIEAQPFIAKIAQ